MTMGTRKRRIWELCAAWAILLAAAASALLAQQALPVQAQPQEGLGLPIIMYHNMSPNASRQGKYTVSVKEFEGDLRYLRERGFTPISTRQLLDYVWKGAALPEKPVMLTFDDGFESFYAYAFPLLQKYHMCAVVAVVGQYADTYTEKEDHHLGYSYLTWPEITELSKSGLVEIQSHTNNMHSITSKRRGCTINKGEDKARYQQILRADLQLNQEKIKTATGKAPVALAYPYGLHCKAAREVLKEMGFQAAFTCAEKVNVIPSGQEDTDWLFTLGRYNRAHGISSQDFLKPILDRAEAGG